jgi:hypothetical protein
MEGEMAGNVVRKMAGNMVPKNGGKCADMVRRLLLP